jgi:S-adenosylmethionine-diacylglycerol 3-amino-3-carboxypropyl transferase
MNFTRTLNFTSANEDGASELAALRLGPPDRVLCLTASGARPLDLLLGDPGSVLAIDINPAQNALLALKIAAIRVLSPEDLYAYLGIARCADRAGLHLKVEAALEAPVRAFWRERAAAIQGGVWLSGRWERVLRMGAVGARLVRGGAVDRLFSACDLATQGKIWDEKFDDWIWRASIRTLSQRWIWTRLVGEPGGAHLPSAAVCEARLGGAFRRAAHTLLFRESDFAWLIFKGRHFPEAALPIHLRRENLDVVRLRLDRIRIRVADLAGLDPSEHGMFTAFSLSDFGSYCDQEGYDACWRSVVRVAAPNARFCERIFMNPLTPGSDISPRLALDAALADAIGRADSAFIYDFRCGEIGRPAD